MARKLQSQTAEFWRGLRGKVVVTSQPRKARRQLAGLPDILVWIRGYHLSLECKEEGDTLRESQVRFLDEVGGHRGPYVLVRVVTSIEDSETIARSLGLVA